MHKNRRRHHIFRIDRPGRHNFFHFHNGGLRRHGHNRIKISRRQPVRQIPQLVRFVRFDKRKVRVNRRLPECSVAHRSRALLFPPPLPFRLPRWCKNQKARGRRAHALAQNSLRHQLQRHFSRRQLLLKISGMRSRKRSNHAAQLPVLEDQAQLAFMRAAIIADGSNVSACPRAPAPESNYSESPRRQIPQT